MKRSLMQKVINHRNDEITAECCTCHKKQRHLHYHWTRQSLGLDGYVLQCPDCQAEEQEMMGKTAALKV